MTDSQIAQDRADRVAGPWVRIVALCLGIGGSLSLIGMAGLYHAILDPLPRTTVLVVAVALLAAAAGPWLPQRIISRQLRSRQRRRPDADSAIRWEFLPRTVTPAQQGLLWVILAVACLGAGTTGLILLWATGPIELAHRWVTERFFVSPAELLAADLAAIVAALVVPWLILGVAVACLYSLAASYDPPTRAGGGLAGLMLIGAALGLALSSWGVFRASPGRTALLGTLPWFLATVLAVGRSGRRRPLDAQDPFPEAQLPEWAPEAGYGLLATLVAWGMLVGTSVAVWPRVVTTGLRIVPAVEPLLGAWVLVWVGVGVVVGGMLARRSTHPVGGCGPAMVLAGAATGLAIGACAVAGTLEAQRSDPGARLTTGLVLTALAIAGLGAGGALPYLRRALIVQSGSPGVTSAQVLTASLAGTVLGAGAGLCWIVPTAGTLVALATAVLLALATGGLLVIFDVGGPSPRQRYRLVGVFTVLLALMIGLPTVSKKWLRWHEDVAAVHEGGWLTLSLVRGGARPAVAVEPRPARGAEAAPNPATMRRALHAVMQLCGRIDRCWVISAGDLAPGPFDHARCRTIEVGTYDPLGARVFGPRSTADDPPPGSDHSPQPALRSLRWISDRYDLIVIASVPGGHVANRAIWTVENFRRAMRLIAPRGVLAGLVRPAAFGRGELATLAVTFAAAVPDPTRAGLVGTGVDQVLVLLASGTPPPIWDWQAAAQAGMYRVGPLKSFRKIARGLLPNTLRAPSLTRLGGPRDGGLQLIRYVSETEAWRRITPGAAPVPVWPPTEASGGPRGAPPRATKTKKSL